MGFLICIHRIKSLVYSGKEVILLIWHIWHKNQIKIQCPDGISVADLRGRERRAPPVQILSISCSFWEILAKSYVGAPLLGSWRPLLGEILDPPLHTFVTLITTWKFSVNWPLGMEKKHFFLRRTGNSLYNCFFTTRKQKSSLRNNAIVLA